MSIDFILSCNAAIKLLLRRTLHRSVILFSNDGFHYSLFASIRIEYDELGLTCNSFLLNQKTCQMKLSKMALLIFISLCLTKAKGQSNSLLSDKKVFEKKLKGWTLSFKNFQLTKFKLTDTLKFEDTQFEDIKQLKEFYKLYKPGLFFSKDSSQFIDIYSYWLNLEKINNKVISNPEVDQAVSLCDLKKRKWTRILFCGSSIRIEEVAWISKNYFILAGTEACEKNFFHPKVYIGDLQKQRFFSYTDISCFSNNKGYNSSKLKKLKIQD